MAQVASSHVASGDAIPRHRIVSPFLTSQSRLKRSAHPAPVFERDEIALAQAAARYSVFCLSPHSLQV